MGRVIDYAEMKKRRVQTLLEEDRRILVAASEFELKICLGRARQREIHAELLRLGGREEKSRGT